MLKGAPAMIFIENKYSKIYYSIMSNAMSRILPTETYTEKHHIIPKSLGGNNSKDNIATLTAREHFICHWLLTKMVDGLQRQQMIHALSGMRRENKHQTRYYTKITSRVFEKLRQELALVTSLRFKNKPLSEEHKDKLRKPKTAETRINMSLASQGKPKGPSKLKGRILSDEHKEKLKISSNLRIHNQPNLGKLHSISTRNKMSIASAKRVKRPCPLCSKEISPNAYKQHYNYCSKFVV